ncbi:MAG TPA: acyl carrier protein [Solirubrobacteraceae bacterium]|nr:acyl carrier protein [Solirubrobacteraceae bacterium]
MTEEEVLALIRTHLADELGIDPARVEPATRFREDLAIDSLDLYTMIQEFEDTYGIRISDEQAMGLQTVGATVDFVRSQVPGR